MRFVADVAHRMGANLQSAIIRRYPDLQHQDGRSGKSIECSLAFELLLFIIKIIHKVQISDVQKNNIWCKLSCKAYINVVIIFRRHTQKSNMPIYILRYMAAENYWLTCAGIMYHPVKSIDVKFVSC